MQENILRSQVMYSVFVRQFSREGTFEGVRAQLGRIRALGTDVIWLMPVHPIGVVRRKGTLGSPYAIMDYRAINPEYGTMEDFVRLVDAIHQNGMRCIIDVVYNHTSPDSWLAKNRPEWFYHKPDGSFGNRVGDWGDVIDLDYEQQGLWRYQIDTLIKWAKIVDGFRCDVAPLVPLAFWQQARAEVEAVRPGCLWLSESVEPCFTLDNRERGMVSLSDGEIFQAFDVAYEYDVYHDFVRYLTDEISLSEYLDGINRQEYIYPVNAVKLRFLENHDRPRAAFLIPDEQIRRNWTAFLFFQKGMTLLYNGQENGCFTRPGLFDKDTVQWDATRDISPFLARLAAMKRDPLFSRGRYLARDAGNGIIRAVYTSGDSLCVGIFSTKGRCAPVRVPMPEGRYKNMADGGDTVVEQGLISCMGEPVVIFLKREEAI